VVQPRLQTLLQEIDIRGSVSATDFCVLYYAPFMILEAGSGERKVYPGNSDASLLSSEFRGASLKIEDSSFC